LGWGGTKKGREKNDRKKAQKEKNQEKSLAARTGQVELGKKLGVVEGTTGKKKREKLKRAPRPKCPPKQEKTGKGVQDGSPESQGVGEKKGGEHFGAGGRISEACLRS